MQHANVRPCRPHYSTCGPILTLLRMNLDPAASMLPSMQEPCLGTRSLKKNGKPGRYQWQTYGEVHPHSACGSPKPQMGCDREDGIFTKESIRYAF